MFVPADTRHKRFETSAWTKHNPRFHLTCTTSASTSTTHTLLLQILKGPYISYPPHLHYDFSHRCPAPTTPSCREGHPVAGPAPNPTCQLRLRPSPHTKTHESSSEGRHLLLGFLNTRYILKPHTRATQISQKLLEIKVHGNTSGDEL